MADSGFSGDQLKSLVERLENLEEEKQAIAEQIREVMAEAKGTGFDTKIIRQLLKLRKMQEHDRMEQEELLQIYKSAVGMG
ncbi:MAG: DUF2312 domain-containing protein [Pseudomonadota bacterium]